jgi:hypothetical protein
MFGANLVCVSLMFNTLKVAQAEKQIYPERFGKVKKPGQMKCGTIRLRRGLEPGL